MYATEPQTTAAMKLNEELTNLDESARRDRKPIRFYELHYASPVSFDLLGRSYRDITRLRFSRWGRSWNTGALSITIGLRAGTRQFARLPQTGEITTVTAAYVAPPQTNLPPLDHSAVLATLTTMREQSKSAGHKIHGYIVEFGQLQSFFMGKRTFLNVARLKFNDFHLVHGDLYVTLAVNARRSYLLPTSRIVRVPPATPSNREDRFASFEDFARRFDKRFIADHALLDLWNSHSCMHAGPFRPSDFKPIGKMGRGVVAEFLLQFTDLDQATPGYNGDGVLTIKHYSQHERLGRDISVSHGIQQGRICYSSEYPGCGNGSYYFLATEKTILHIEDD
jgi:hypothetical protein